MNENNLPNEKLVGVEVSGASLKAVCLDKSGAILDSVKHYLNPEPEIVTQLIAFLGDLQAQFGEFKKIGVAVPGLLDWQTRRVALSAHLPEQTEIDLGNEIKNKTGIEAVLENDANAAAYGEYILGAGRGSRDIFYVTLGRGVGGAFIFDGKLYRGVSGFAGEIGYITIDSKGTRLEEVASAENFLRRVRVRVSQDNTSSLASIDEQEITVKDVVRAAAGGDDFSMMMLERTGNYIGTAIANVINLLNIEKIIIGGEIMEIEDLVVDAVAERARSRSFEAGFAATRIVAGELGGKAAAIGAALLSQESLERSQQY
ncbi:MAG: ROK family protein [Pyrinomonadaceae bacterium]